MSDTLIGSLWGGIVVLAGSILTWLYNRGKARQDGALTQAQLDAQQRREDIDLIIEELKETVKRQGEELGALRRENKECWADRDQMRGELRRLTRRLEEVERHEGEGC